MAEGETLLNAAIGAGVGVVASGMLPLGPAIGGAVAGYLQGGDRTEALRVGAIAGALMLVPMVLFLAVVGPLFLALLGGYVGVSGFGIAGGLGLLVLVVVLVVGAATTVGLSAGGAYLGNYVKYDTDIDL